MLTKDCVRCGASFSNRYGTGRVMTTRDWARQSYCSRTCYLADVTREQSKVCEQCGQGFTRARYNGRLESTRLFARRKYCSRTCWAEGQRIARSAVPGADYREHLKNYCEACGDKDNLHGHHIDHDHTNNQPENIQTLCEHCHGFWHGTQVRLKLSVIGRMPQLLVFNA